MTKYRIPGITLLLFTFVLQVQGSSSENAPQTIRAVLVGMADRWADYGSRGDVPSVRDFLAVERLRRSDGVWSSKFIKVRMLYWPQDKSDPRRLVLVPAHEAELMATRETSCDESFSNLSRTGQVSFLDPNSAVPRQISIWALEETQS